MRPQASKDAPGKHPRPTPPSQLLLPFSHLRASPGTVVLAFQQFNCCCCTKQALACTFGGALGGCTPPKPCMSYQAGPACPPCRLICGGGVCTELLLCCGASGWTLCGTPSARPCFFPVILVLVGLTPYSFGVGVCATVHILGTLIRAWLREIRKARALAKAE